MQLYSGDALAFSPSATPIDFTQTRQFSNPVPRRDGLDVLDFTDDPKVHLGRAVLCIMSE
ncbi:MAG: hypothetical protein GWN29_01155 [Gammaproteobacteria bacterium]|nr:hypothetical protein [Gammaproteobacteria bacterium]